MILIMAGAILARGQGFLNLDFESAYNLPGNPGPNGTLVSVTNALPDWIAYEGDSVLSEVYYGSNTLDYEAGPELEGGSLAFSGNFSVGLYQNSEISQTGLVPAHAESLEFEASGPDDSLLPEATGFSVTLGGQTLSYTEISEGPNYFVYGVNIPTAMDAQMEAWNFSCENPGTGQVLLDNIEFSTMSIPEPSECGLVGIAVIALGVLRRRK